MGNTFVRPQWPDMVAFLREANPNVTRSDLDACELNMRRCQKGQFIAAVNRIVQGAGHSKLCHDVYDGYCTPATVRTIRLHEEQAAGRAVTLQSARHFPYDK